MGQVGIAEFADAAALAVEPLGVGAGVKAHHGGGVRLAEGVAAAEQPQIVHFGVGFQVAGGVDDSHGYRGVRGFLGFPQHSGHRRLHLFQFQGRFGH